MTRSLYIGASSMVVNQRRMDVLANNLANINTPGYKKDFSVVESFPEKLMAKLSGTPERARVPKEFGLKLEEQDGIYTVRIEEGFFTVESPKGNSHVKDLKFTIDEEGYLKTFYRTGDAKVRMDHENYILDKNGKRIQAEPEEVFDVLNKSVRVPLPHVIGTMSGGVRFHKLSTDFSKGGFMDTGGKLDLALKGEGLFKIMGEEGRTFYTRNGSFAVSEGVLTTLDGRPVMGRSGAIPIDGSEIDVAEDGRVSVDGNLVDVIQVVDVENKEQLRKIGDNLFEIVSGAEVQEIPASPQVVQGVLETSNMNAISAMVEMISLQRDYDTNSKVVRTADEMLEKSANELARI